MIWGKPTPGRRVVLLAKKALESVLIREKLTPLPKPTVLAHAQVFSLHIVGWASQSVYMKY